MNAVLIANHNNRVKENDTIFIIGDFCFRNTKGGKVGEGELTKAEEYISKLNGRKVFIRGNHDDNNSLNTPILSCILEHGGRMLYLVHNPEDYEPGFLNLCGHVHTMWTFKRMPDGTDIINVGVDQWSFRPVHITEIMKEYGRWKHENGYEETKDRAKVRR